MYRPSIELVVSTTVLVRASTSVISFNRPTCVLKIQVAIYTFWHELKHMIYVQMQIHHLIFQIYYPKLSSVYFENYRNNLGLEKNGKVESDSRDLVF